MAVLEIAAGHRPFSDQFQHMANHNLFWSAKLTVHFQWEGNTVAYKKVLSSKSGLPISDPYFYHLNGILTCSG